VWLWGLDQETAFIMAKETLTKPIILALYCPGGRTKVAADAPSLDWGSPFPKTYQ